jgi:hypothetical protein
MDQKSPKSPKESPPPAQKKREKRTIGEIREPKKKREIRANGRQTWTDLTARALELVGP